jgi:hypothetical protein
MFFNTHQRQIAVLSKALLKLESRTVDLEDKNIHLWDKVKDLEKENRRVVGEKIYISDLRKGDIIDLIAEDRSEAGTTMTIRDAVFVGFDNKTGSFEIVMIGELLALKRAGYDHYLHDSKLLKVILKSKGDSKN